MTIKTKLTESDYVKASLTTIASRPVIKYFLSVFLIICLINFITGFFKSGISISSVLPPVIILSLYAILLYYGLKRGYKGNKRAGETIAYTFGDTNLIITGESFKSELTWDKIYKVSKTKKWLLIWQSKQIANAIPKRDLPLEGLDSLKNILTKNGVKNNL